MQSSYTKNYFKIYVTQFLAILINVLSLVIVIPYLSGNAKVYGIYTLSISFTIFLSYADLGFLNAGYKYASEYFIKNDKKKEIEIIGLVSFILLVFVLLFSSAIFLIAFHPNWLVKNISTASDLLIAKHLLLILACFSPVIVLQRMLQIIYGVRVQDYIFQRILIVVNSLKICSIYFFVSKNQCDVVGYFLFCQSITAAGLLTGMLYASKKYSIPVKYLLKNIRFKKTTFYTIKDLAFSSLYVTIAWILFYEFDPYVIAKLSGAEAVAFYSIGLTCLAFFRSIFGALFGPFSARFNHFTAVNDLEGLAGFSKTVMCILLPAVVFPSLSLALLSKPFVFTWVGDKFQVSAQIVTLLSLCNVMAFITYPASILAIATKKIRLLYIVSTLQIIIYWGGIAILFPHYGFIVFAYCELTCFSVTGIVYTWFICRFLRKNIFEFLKEIILPAVLPALLLIFILLSIRNYLPLAKNKLFLLEIALTGVVATVAATIVYYFTSEFFRNYSNRIISKIRYALLNLTIKKNIHLS